MTKKAAAERCPACGHEGNSPDWGVCEVCGHLRMARRVILRCPKTGRQITLRVTTPVGRHLLRQVLEDANFCDEPQFVIERRLGAGRWMVVPAPGARNLTCLDGRPLREPSALRAGARLSVGAEKAAVIVELED